MRDTLYISHNIFLSREQRYNLYSGKKEKVVGVNVSCWSPKKMIENEYTESFCFYRIIPKRKTNYKIKKTQKGYLIYLTNNKIFSIFDFIYNHKNENRVNDNDVKNLLDIKDGGKEWMFLKEETNQNNLTIKHSIEIHKLESLLESI